MCARRLFPKWWQLPLIIGFLFGGSKAIADETGVDLRYGKTIQGTLGSDIAIDVELTPFIFNVDYAIALNRENHLLASGQIHLSQIAYEIDGSEKIGVYSSFGLGAGYLHTFSPTIRWYGDFVFYPWAQLIAASQNTRTVNGEPYVHSSLSQYSQGTGFELTGGVFYSYRYWPFTTKILRGKTGRLGVLVGYLIQDFKKKVDQISTSTGTKETVESESHFRLSAITLTLPIGIEF